MALSPSGGGTGAGGVTPGPGPGGLPGPRPIPHPPIPGGGQTSQTTAFSTPGAAPLTPNGGVTGTNQQLLFAMANVATNQVWFYALNPFISIDDPNDGGFYSYRVEEVDSATTPTVRRGFVTYRDFGPAQFTVTVTSVDDNGNIQTGTNTVNVGTTNATGRLCGKFFDFNGPTTGWLPQLTISRIAGSGPLSIAKMKMFVEVEESTY